MTFADISAWSRDYIKKKRRHLMSIQETRVTFLILFYTNETLIENCTLL